MKKSALLTTIAFAFIMLFSTNANAQKFPDLDKSPMDAAIYRTDRNAPPVAKVVYSRPQLKGRSLDKLAPNGKMWRTGANEGTEITFYKDVNFGGKAVKAGTYTLTTIPGEKEWTVVLNSNLNVWGGGAFGYNEDTEVTRFSVPATMADDSVEAFVIAFDEKGTMHMAWDKVRVAVPMN